MAEQNRNGTWSTESQDPTHDIIPDHVFHDMFTDQPPHEFTKMDGSGEVVDPVTLAEAGTHELVYCITKEHLERGRWRRQVPDAGIALYRSDSAVTADNFLRFTVVTHRENDRE